MYCLFAVALSRNGVVLIHAGRSHPRAEYLTRTGAHSYGVPLSASCPNVWSRWRSKVSVPLATKQVDPDVFYSIKCCLLGHCPLEPCCVRVWNTKTRARDCIKAGSWFRCLYLLGHTIRS
ncbi:hypothetical protein BDZ89DRAFT_665334 [Hymenopellis radicata]|nr:hypothetical protein BDZ89DRAFT_665334 [Hymenopellis radicata]